MKQESLFQKRKYLLNTEETPLPQLESKNIQIQSLLANYNLNDKTVGFINEKHYSFNQAYLINEIEKNLEDYPTLNNNAIKYNGLCEFICNHIIIDDLLDEVSINTISKIELNKTSIKMSHILDVSTFFEKLKAYFFNVYPCGIFEISEKVLLDKKLNKTLLENKLNKLQNNTYIKIYVFIKKFFNFNGHSMLIKKLPNNNYTFFDPNKGTFLNLNINDLCDKIDSSMQEYQGTHLVFINGTKYIEQLRIKGIVPEQKNIVNHVSNGDKITDKYSSLMTASKENNVFFNSDIITSDKKLNLNQSISNILLNLKSANDSNLEIGKDTPVHNVPKLYSNLSDTDSTGESKETRECYREWKISNTEKDQTLVISDFYKENVDKSIIEKALTDMTTKICSEYDIKQNKIK